MAAASLPRGQIHCWANDHICTQIYKAFGDASRRNAPMKGIIIVAIKSCGSPLGNAPGFCLFEEQMLFNCRSAGFFLKCISLYFIWPLGLCSQQQSTSCVFGHMHKELTLSTATECISLVQFYILSTEQTLNKHCLQKLAVHPHQSNFPWSQNLRNPSPRRKHWPGLNSFKERREERKPVHQVLSSLTTLA